MRRLSYTGGLCMQTDTENVQVVKSVFEGLHLKLVLAGFGQVSPGWGRHEFVPTYNRMYYIIEGKCRIRIGEREFIASSGQLIVIPAGTPLSYCRISGEPLIKFWCHFSAKVGHLELFQMIEFPRYIQVERHEQDDLRTVFDRLLEAKKQIQDIASPLKIHKCLTELMIYLTDHASPIMLNTTTASTNYSQIHSYIEEHLAESLTLEKLASVFHYNPNYFIRYFKSMFNLSPYQYINKVRLEKGQRMLAHTEISICKIAKNLGMKPIHFTKMFKQATSLSPTDYRNMHTNSSKAHNIILGLTK
jgi:AraC family transcriptional regulator of arabinose operon